MKLKEFGHGGGHVPRTPSLDPPMNYYNYYVSKELIYMLCQRMRQRFPAIFEFRFVFSTKVIRHTKCFLGYYGGKHFIGDED